MVVRAREEAGGVANFVFINNNTNNNERVILIYIVF